MDFSLLEPFTTVSGWATILMLMMLELALGVDNIVFISITSDRVKEEHKSLARKLGLLAAMITRCLLLCTIVSIMSINVVLFTMPFGGNGPGTAIDVKDMVFLIGGIYLVYKGISELREEHASIAAAGQDDNIGEGHHKKHIGLARAIVTIMIMDIIFSLDSVITAAGLSGQILVMIVAVICAIMIMIIFADPISNFINQNFEVKVMALLFIMLVGVELILKGLHYETIAGAEISTLLYAMMLFGFIASVVIMRLRKAREKGMSRKLESDENDGT